jgi:hypothetical protein
MTITQGLAPQGGWRHAERRALSLHRERIRSGVPGCRPLERHAFAIALERQEFGARIRELSTASASSAPHPRAQHRIREGLAR